VARKKYAVLIIKMHQSGAFFNCAAGGAAAQKETAGECRPQDAAA
jgi:hypothetical protein